MSNRAKLDNWVVRMAHPAGTICLGGDVMGHPNPRLEDGDRIWTSQVLSWTGRTVRTRNTTYTLGDFYDA
jgi:hypothetical protein